MSEEQACDLCGLPVGQQPFALHTSGRELQFCCEGCRGIYEMLHDIQEIPVQNDDKPTNES